MSREHEHPLDKGADMITVGYLASTAISLAVIGIAFAVLKSWLDVPFGFAEPWESRDSLFGGLASVWFIFAWGAGFTLLVGIVDILRKEPRKREPSELFSKGTWLSLNAGFFEEVIYRWLALFGSMIIIKLLDAIMFGFMEWLYTTLLIPFANWASFGLLEPQFYGSYGWLLAAGIVSANVRFRDGHEYQGLFGMINAWYIGLFMFYLMFNYGLLAAIVAHVAHDLCVFWARGTAAYFQPRNRTWRLTERLALKTMELKNSRTF